MQFHREKYQLSFFDGKFVCSAPNHAPLEGFAEPWVQARLLEDGVQAVVLATDSLKSGRLEGVADPKGNGEISNREITQTLSQVVQYLLRRHPFGALLLSGGDTAYLQDRCVQRTGDAG